MKTVKDYIDTINSISKCMMELDAIEDKLINDDDVRKAEIINNTINHLRSYTEVLKCAKVKRCL